MNADAERWEPLSFPLIYSATPRTAAREQIRPTQTREKKNKNPFHPRILAIRSGHSPFSRIPHLIELWSAMLPGIEFATFKSRVSSLRSHQETGDKDMDQAARAS